MQIDECRDAFEKWATEQRFQWQFTRGVVETIYDNPLTQQLWLTWQSAWSARPKRESIEYSPLQKRIFQIIDLYGSNRLGEILLEEFDVSKRTDIEGDKL